MGHKFVSLVIFGSIASAFVGLLLPHLGISLFSKSNGEKCNTSSDCDKEAGLTCLLGEKGMSCQCNALIKMWDENAFSCVDRKLPNEQCQSNECSILQGLVCLDGLCQCETNEVFSIDANACIEKRVFNEACLEGQCIDGLECVDSKCNCDDTERFWDQEYAKCVPKRLEHGQCLSNLECSESKGLVCRDNECLCSYPNQFWIDGQCITKKMHKESCEDSSVCASHKGLECIDNICQCSDPTKFFADSSECVIGVANNVSTSHLFESGFVLVYNKAYEWHTTDEEIKEIRSYCTDTSVLCMAGADDNGDNLITVACGNCLHVTAETVQNEPQYHGKVWWYNTPGISIGFSPIQKVVQNKADPLEEEGHFRLSWHLESGGGWRVGNMQFLAESEDVFKYVFLKT